jgi:hypothetical protein
MKSVARCFLLVFLIGVLARCTCSATSEYGTRGKDGVDRVSREFGVPRERVLEVVEMLEVDPNEIETFGGSYFFPYNYYEYQFREFQRKHGRPPRRSEVEQLIVGYVAKCPWGEGVIDYIYYSDRTHGGTHEIAMAFTVVFQLSPPSGPVPEDPLFSGMKIVNLRDGSVNPPSNTYWDDCIREYRRDH